ncbi:MAG: aldo/keto reductase [Propionibacteriaceae bacterium]|nr:aldo/keto reductase [Propionibacteriaceae bacterium]
MSIPTYSLNDGLAIPAIGFGTAKLHGFAATDAILSALDVGYRLIDTAMNYDNEGAVGKAVRLSGVPREQILVTTKLPGRFHEHDLAVAAVEESITRMGLDHVDIVLIHWPNPSRDRYVEAWQSLIECRERGLVRTIGVSNFLPQHLTRLVTETGVTPALNQIERHPFHQQSAQLAFDAELGIRDEAWSPLAREHWATTSPVVSDIAALHGKTPTQIVLAWHVASGVVAIPKSATPTRQAENLDIFDITLSTDEMAAITSLDGSGQRIVAEDSTTHEEM